MAGWLSPATAANRRPVQFDLGNAISQTSRFRRSSAYRIP
jgi:hypothetical protein